MAMKLLSFLFCLTITAGCGGSEDARDMRVGGEVPFNNAGAGAGGAAGISGAGGVGANGGIGGAAGTAGTPPVAMFGDDCAAEGAEAEVGIEGADIVWVVDNSCSMAVEAQAVQDNMNSFATSLIDRGIDVQLALISSADVSNAGMACPQGDFACLINQISSGFNYGVCIDAPFGSGMCPADSNPPKFQHLDVPVGSKNGLQLIMDQYPQYVGSLRPNTKKHFVMITDDDSNVPAATFQQWVDSQDPALFGNGWFFHGIYSMTQCADAAAVGTVYETLIGQTMGVAGDLCLQQFQPVFDAVAADVAQKAEIACDWPIPVPPPGQTLDPAKVNVQYTEPGGQVVSLGKIASGEDCAGREGWQYDNDLAPTQVVSCPAACERFQSTGGKVDVLFGCRTQVLD